MDTNRPVTVFFSRAAYAPSQRTVDIGRAAVGSGLGGLTGFTGTFLALMQIPLLRGEPGAIFHLKGLAATWLPFLPKAWSLDWVDACRHLDLPIQIALTGRCSFALVVGTVLALRVWSQLAQPVDGYIHIRGRRLLEGQAALAAARQVSALEIGKHSASSDIHIHPEVRLSGDRMTKHGILFGKVGGGKTTILLPMIAEILAAGHKAIIFDIKGDFTAKFWQLAGPVALLAPWDERSLIWDIARDCRTRQDAARFAAYLIKESKDPMWSSAARQLCVGFLVHLQMTRGEHWGWQDLADMLATPEKELQALMAVANPEAIRAVEQTGTTTTGILINLSAFLSVIYDLAEAWPERVPGRMFSVQRWIASERPPHRAILLGGNKEFGGLMSAFAGALIAQAAAAICSPRLSDSRTRRLYFILDEFPQLGKVDIEPLVAVGRSKGVRVWLGLQDFGQLKQRYGADTAQAITAMVGTIICAGAAPGETAKLIAEMAGNREVERSSFSTSVQGGTSSASTSQSWQRETLPVLTESQVAGLGPVAGKTEIRALVLNLGEDALILRWPFDTRPNIAEPTVMAAWTLPTVEKQRRAQARAEMEAIAFLEGEEREEAAHRLNVLVAMGEGNDRPQPELNPDQAIAWLAQQSANVTEPEIAAPSRQQTQGLAQYIVDAPSVQSPPNKKHSQSRGDDEAPAETQLTEQLLQQNSPAGEMALGDAGAALLKLAEVADALRQKPGPTREQAPPQRRIR